MNFKRGASYADSPGWIKNIKATINPVNKKGKRCFHYAVTIELAWRSKKRPRKNYKN